MIKILVSLEREEEIEKTIEIKSKIHDLLKGEGLRSGTSINNSPKTFWFEIKEV